MAFDHAHQALIAEVKVAAETVALVESVAKAALLAHFQRTGESDPVTGASVKMFTVLVYDYAAALAWAHEKQMALVPESLDVKAFEKIAKVTPLPCVSIRTEHRAQLSAALGAVPAP